MILIDGAIGLIMGIVLGGALILVLSTFKAPSNIFLNIIFIALLLPVIEETFKYLPLESSFIKSNYIIAGLMIGLGFGLIESFYYGYLYLNQLGSIFFLYRFKAVSLHILTGGIMGFAVSKRKGWLGLLLAIVLHTLFNFYIDFK